MPPALFQRFNELRPRANNLINFVRAIPGLPDTPQAQVILDRLAAEVHPVMVKFGFRVGTFEECQPNPTFVGRSWEDGETIEIVLRKSVSGPFLPEYAVLNTLCHELAHCRYRHHGLAFQQLWQEIRAEVQAHQQREPSSAHQDVMLDGDLGEIQCLVSKQRKKAQARPSVPTPASSTSKKPRSSTSKRAFSGKGQKLDDSPVNNHRVRAGYRKQAQSISARNDRARAAEAHLASVALTMS